MNKTKQVAFKVVKLSSIPNRERSIGAGNPTVSRYSAAITAAARYVKRAILLDTGTVTTRRAALQARYGILSALKSRKLDKTITIVQRGNELYLLRKPTNKPSLNVTIAKG